MTYFVEGACRPLEHGLLVPRWARHCGHEAQPTVTRKRMDERADATVRSMHGPIYRALVHREPYSVLWPMGVRTRARERERELENVVHAR